jgi:C-3',4' desaturase CrtD
VKRERFDAIVIGAGLSGATAAALLAQRGHRVAVLERDAHAGGCAASWDEDGYRFAVGATVGMGLEPKGVVRRVYERLGLTPSYRHVDPAIRVLVGDRTVDLHQDRGAWLAEVARAFPGQERAKRAFWERVARLARGLAHASSHFPVMPFAHPLDLLDTARGAHPALLSVFAQLRRSVADLLADHGIEDHVHRAFIDGQLIDAMQTTADDCAAPNGALALDVYRFGAQYLEGGLGRIADDFLASAMRRGGSVRFATRARRILVDGAGRVEGVATRSGEILAPIVISSVPLANTAHLLGGDLAAPLAARAERQALSSGPFTLYLGVDASILPADAHLYHQVTDLPMAPNGATPVHDGGNLLISISPAWDTSRAPAGKRAITVSTHVDAAGWLALAEDPVAYSRAKGAFSERLLDQLERWFPRLRSGIEVLHAGTPRTFYRYTRRHGGTAGGFAQSVGQANFAAPSHRSGIPGLLLAGDTIFPGPGALGVTISGFNAARTAHRALRARHCFARGFHPAEPQEVAA